MPTATAPSALRPVDPSFHRESLSVSPKASLSLFRGAGGAGGRGGGRSLLSRSPGASASPLRPGVRAPAGDLGTLGLGADGRELAVLPEAAGVAGRPASFARRSWLPWVSLGLTWRPPTPTPLAASNAGRHHGVSGIQRAQVAPFAFPASGLPSPSAPRAERRRQFLPSFLHAVPSPCRPQGLRAGASGPRQWRHGPRPPPSRPGRLPAPRPLTRSPPFLLPRPPGRGLPPRERAPPSRGWMRVSFISPVCLLHTV